MAERKRRPLTLVLMSGGYDRVHYGLAMAAAAAASDRPTTLFFTGRALLGLTGTGPNGGPGWHGLDPADDGSPPETRDAVLTSRGVAGFEALLAACTQLPVRVVACEMGLRAVGLTGAALRSDLTIDPGGLVGVLAPDDGAVIVL